MFLTPVSRNNPITKFRHAASSCGADPVRTWAVVFSEGHAPYPVHLVLNPPRSPPYLQQPGSIRTLR